MRGRIASCRKIHAFRIGFVVSIAALAAGCSGSGINVPGASLFAANNPPEQTGAIESRDLNPIGTGPTAYAATPITTPASLRQRGWSVEGAPIVEVSAGDTAMTLSQGFNVPVEVILEANGLSTAQQIQPGSRVVIPTYVRIDQPSTTPNFGPASVPAVASAAPGQPGFTVAAGTGQQMATAQTGLGDGAPGLGTPPQTLSEQAAGTRHEVRAGETLYSIARTYNVPHTEIAALNGIDPNTMVQTGQVLRIPGKGGPAATQVAVLTPSQTPPVVSDADPAMGQPQAPAVAAPSAPVTPAPQQAAVTTEAPAATQGASGFRWPLRGAIVAGFGKQADGERNDGINLAAPAGTPVQAAENGKVIYAGNELEGYGNLVLIQHADDWVSAYAHNSTLMVSRGDTVQRGQTIAAVGNTGSVQQPQLHFELRRGSTPVDPLPHLSGA